MKFVLSALFAALPALTLPHAALAEGRTIVVLDGSGSMWGQIDGRPKLEIAREALTSVLAGIPQDRELGLMAYGHREKGACSDIELVVSPGPGTAPAIAAAADGMHFLGKTPLSDAVRRAAAELRHTEEKATVILITDGIETCAADPCAVGAELEASGVDFTAHVVGFGLSDEEGRAVACLAENTGGQFVSARDGAALTDALRETVAAGAPPSSMPQPVAPPPAPAEPVKVEANLAPDVMLAEGVELPEGFGYALTLTPVDANGAAGPSEDIGYRDHVGFHPPGRYRLTASTGGFERFTEVTLTEDRLAQPMIFLDAGVLTVRSLAEAGGAPVDGAPVTFRQPDGFEKFNYGVVTELIPGGETEIIAEVGLAKASVTTRVIPGETRTIEIVAAAGSVVVQSYLVAGELLANDGQPVTIYAAPYNPETDYYNSIAYSYGQGASFVLAPGDYVALLQKDEASSLTPFTVEGGKETVLTAVLNAGVIEVSAPGATYVEFFRLEGGERVSIRYDYAESVVQHFPPGNFVVVADRDGVKSESGLSLAAGQRAAVTIP
jgi:Ca-activated chloride channel family protein